jgi:uncharacterized glyoxalase superfamily protein PhnB
MTQHSEPPRIFPTYRYRNASAMVEWLVEIFGFTVQAKYMDGGKVAHAQLAFGASMIMLGDVKPDSFGEIVGDPGQPGGKSTYIAVEVVDALYARATAAGATIEEPPTDRAYGSREFICRDPEGNVWCFGTYWPKAVDPSH